MPVVIPAITIETSSTSPATTSPATTSPATTSPATRTYGYITLPKEGSCYMYYDFNL